MSSEDDRSMLTVLRFKMPRLSNGPNRLRHLTVNVRLEETFSSAPHDSAVGLQGARPAGRILIRLKRKFGEQSAGKCDN